MQENRYYVPDIEELYMGYECELNYQKKEWYKPLYFDVSDLSDINERMVEIRTKYLDKEDIESLKWKHLVFGYQAISIDCIGFNNGKYQLVWDEIHTKLRIRETVEIEGSEYYEILYFGTCKSINELRKLMKCLDIKIDKNE